MSGKLKHTPAALQDLGGRFRYFFKYFLLFWGVEGGGVQAEEGGCFLFGNRERGGDIRRGGGLGLTLGGCVQGGGQGEIFAFRAEIPTKKAIAIFSSKRSLLLQWLHISLLLSPPEALREEAE